ncbi:MAG TPA: 23S rRNA (adenine(2503)-C(2))-methyltransferase RlmN [Chitinispirillaceae bacterium]|nr:23S rRNA (adenine(2503)-C(2))-methyltransferase RlmN [Chitinispirillaceae bacterium]
MERLKNLTLNQIRQWVVEQGEPEFRAEQIIKWLYQKRVSSFDEMKNVSGVFRKKLLESFSIDKLKPLVVLESKTHDAAKFGFQLSESLHMVECVLLIDDDRRTACISSQLGCGLGCVFCETGKMGFIRNLTQDEILGQLIGINDYLISKGDKLVTNIVFMGMGEALSNYSNFISSLSIIMDNDTFNIGGRKITVSTAGVIPSIEKLIGEGLNIGLAISLNAYTNRQRDALMPINNVYPIEQLIAIAKRYFEATGRRVTFEYVIIDGETDTKEALDALFRMLSGFPCKVNCIPVNPSTASAIKIPDERTVERFANELHRRGIAATVRRSKGRDISGACGQLAGKVIVP